MYVKHSVRFKVVNKWTVQFQAACLKAERDLGLPITMTSANDGAHSKTSLHYEDKAWDLRINNISHSDAEKRRDFLAAELGYGWDVIIERYENPENDHIHCERDDRQYPEK